MRILLDLRMVEPNTPGRPDQLIDSPAASSSSSDPPDPLMPTNISSREGINYEVPSNYVPYLTHQPSLDEIKRQDQASKAGSSLYPSTVMHSRTKAWSRDPGSYHREFYEGPATSTRVKMENEPSRTSIYDYGISTAEDDTTPGYALHEQSIYETCYGLYRDERSEDEDRGGRVSTPKEDPKRGQNKNKRSHPPAAPSTPLRRKKSKNQLSNPGRLGTKHGKGGLDTVSEGEQSLQMPLLDSRSLLHFFRSPEAASKRSRRDSDTELSDTGDRRQGNEATDEPGRFLNIPPMPMPSTLIHTKKVEATPGLIRTSEIGHGTAPEYFYGGAYANREREPEPAILEIVGDLGLVASDQWTEDELKQSRRLVAFERQQDGRVLKLSHKVISQQEYEEQHSESDTVVSCIWDRRSKTCFITSADVLSIMECLVGVPFYMTEKNRLRRNLEYARPQTVSKSGEFSQLFDLIMSYNEPRPRKIIKDTKVIKWSLLAKALHKLISKYSTL